MGCPISTEAEQIDVGRGGVPRPTIMLRRVLEGIRTEDFASTPGGDGVPGGVRHGVLDKLDGAVQETYVHAARVIRRGRHSRITVGIRPCVSVEGA